MDSIHATLNSGQEAGNKGSKKKSEVVDMKKTAVFILALAFIIINATPAYAKPEYSEESIRLGREDSRNIGDVKTAHPPTMSYTSEATDQQTDPWW